jgi:UDP-N-acetylmuramoylalanine--D-glutamate ligase (EC 6.3.2.9)
MATNWLRCVLKCRYGTETLQQAMEQIAAQVQSGDMVVLSPACASLDQFRNFEQRGDIFTQLAKELG